MKKHLSTILLVLVFFTGVAILLYPAFSDWWNSMRQSQVITEYDSIVTDMDDEESQRILEEARAYNENLPKGVLDFQLSEEELEEYNSVLNVTPTGVMGTIQIPAIGVSLPIYHGTSSSVLALGVGHVEGTALPVGGLGTHCVLSGHRGLPSASLFTDLGKVVVGDLFMIETLDEVLTYEVDQIRIVLPENVGDLVPDPDMDYCTLVTCTPYSVNTHRLLVRGHRVESASNTKQYRVPADAMQIEPMIVAAIVGAAILMVLLVILFISTSRLNTRNEKQSEKENRKEKAD